MNSMIWDLFAHPSIECLRRDFQKLRGFWLIHNVIAQGVNRRAHFPLSSTLEFKKVRMLSAIE
jgi:hypothetical protein